MKLQNKKILVTGAGGFIGSHLVEHLVKAGASVKAFVRYNSKNYWGWLENSPYQERIEVYTGDIRDYDSVKSALKDTQIVFHLAALIGIPYSYVSPLAYIKTNVEGTYNILQAARELGTEKVVHTSTSEVYGTARFVPITEEHPLQGQSPYSASKIGADQLALSFYSSFKTPVTIIRPFNTYGPRQSARAVIPTIITQIAAGVKTIKLGATQPTRDFNYIKDTVNGFIAAAELDQAIGEVVNLGSNYEISIGETVTLIAELMNADIQIETDQQRIRPEHSEVERLWAENAKAKRILGWEPAFGGREGFKRGLKETIAWFTEPENLSRYKIELYQV